MHHDDWPLSDTIPSSQSHRGVPLHDDPDPDRYAVVVAQIDHVLDCVDAPKALFELVRLRSLAPEARIAAYMKCRAAVAEAREKRRPPPVDEDLLRCHAANALSRHWRSDTHYCCLDEHFDDGPPPVRRKVPLACA